MNKANMMKADLNKDFYYAKDVDPEIERLRKRIADLEEELAFDNLIAKLTIATKRIAELKEEIQDRADTEASLVKQLMKADEVKAGLHVRITELEKLLGMDTPFPVWEILRELVTASEILLHDHSYDGHGYEQIGIAVEYAKKFLPPKRKAEGGADARLAVLKTLEEAYEYNHGSEDEEGGADER